MKNLQHNSFQTERSQRKITLLFVYCIGTPTEKRSFTSSTRKFVLFVNLVTLARTKSKDLSQKRYLNKIKDRKYDENRNKLIDKYENKDKWIEYENTKIKLTLVISIVSYHLIHDKKEAKFVYLLLFVLSFYILSKYL